ncbi:hypothetical protein [Tenacibaculum aestuarii]|uniref:hypothetical protein n=1 Tax=Tenacibaculum aestuarii TaxID=362781 RepID=UPI0038957F50
MSNKNLIILIIGGLLIFSSLYVFTRPAIFEEWNFTETGQIGDTIGGITAPVINLIGAFLVYISFQEQIKANRIQMDALNEEKERNSNDRKFNNYHSLYDSIKSHLDNLEFIVQPKPILGSDNSLSTPNHIIFKGLNALNEYVLRIENSSHYYGEKYEVFGIFLSFQFILKSLIELDGVIELNIDKEEDKMFLKRNIKLMYGFFLKGFAERILKVYNSEEPYIKELKSLKDKLDEEYDV